MRKALAAIIIDTRQVWVDNDGVETASLQMKRNPEFPLRYNQLFYMSLELSIES